MANQVISILGKDCGVLMNTGTVAVPVFTYIGCFETVSLDLKTAEIEVTCGASSGFKEFLAGLHEWNLSVTGTVRHADGTAASLNITAENLLDMQVNRTLLQIQFQVGNGGTGYAIYSGLAYLTSNQVSAPITGKATFTAALRGTAILTKTLAP